MALQATDIADLVTSTINELGRMKFTDIATDIQEHVMLPKILKKNLQDIQAGPQVQFNLMTDHNNSARFVGLGAQDVVDIPDLMTSGRIDWKHITSNYAIEHHVVSMNSSPAKIVDIVTEQRFGCLISMAEKFERAGWQCPAADDTVSPNGVPYWIVKSNTEGFYGLAGSGLTLVGNINPSTQPRWRNWTAQYTAIAEDDLIAKLKKASFYTNWKPAVEGLPTYNTGDDYGFYTNYAVVAGLEQLARAQNENLGTDVAAMDGVVQFKRRPVQPVKILDDDTTDPVYGINWGEFKTIKLAGWWMRETRIPIQPGQHTVSATHVDCSFNWITRNRRRHFVVAKNTGLPA